MRSTNDQLAWLWVLAATVVLFVFGCATPAPLVGLVPRNPNDVIWVDGRAALAREQDGVRVATAFEGQRGDLLGLRLEIENKTESRVQVSPDEITFMTCTERDWSTCAGSYDIVDPEERLGAIDEANSRERASASNSEAVLGTLTILSAVTDVAAIATRTTTPTTGLGTAAAGDALDNAEANHAGAQATFATERQLWSDVAFRRNTLSPGRGASGLIYLPIDPKAAYVWVHVRAGGHVFPFGFQQIVKQVGARSYARSN
jgi:hypothetical protein